jgi:hypothetical protein
LAQIIATTTPDNSGIENSWRMLMNPRFFGSLTIRSPVRLD